MIKLQKGSKKENKLNINLHIFGFAIWITSIRPLHITNNTSVSIIISAIKKKTKSIHITAKIFSFNVKAYLKYFSSLYFHS